MNAKSKLHDPPLFEPSSVDDFATVGLDAFLVVHADVDEHALETALRDRGREATEAGDARVGRVFGLLAGLMSFHLRPDDPAGPFGPKLVMGGRRTMVPSDVRGEQSEVLAAIVERIGNPALRARVGDTAFFNGRRQHAAGRTAMTAYCELAMRRLDGTIIRDFPDLPLGLHDVVDPIKRAVGLMALLHRRGEVADVVRDAFDRAWRAASESDLYVPFVELADVGLSARMIDPEEVARSAEELALAAPSNAYPEAVKRVWLLAARCHHRLGRKVDEDRCGIAAAEQTLRMRDHCNGSLARAHWTKQAVAELRHYAGTGDRVRGLLEEMRQLQLAAQGEMSVFSMEMDLTEEREKAVRVFGNVSLPEAFLALAQLADPPDVGELRRLVLDEARGSFVETMFGACYLDAEGKEVARIAPPAIDGEPDEAWIRAACVRHMSFVRTRQVGGFIEPGRRTLLSRFSVEERHLLPITHVTPFVPPGHGNLFSLGFARMFQGDYVSAAHILFPQLENSLRHLLVLANAEPAKIEADLLQGDRALGALLDVNRADLERMWGANVVHEIDLLFNFRPGPSLRNELAHGKMPWGAFHGPDAVVGCWFIFNLACRPLLDDWDEQVAPAIEREL